MSRQDNPNTPLSLETPIDEDRVRRALGLKTNGATHQQRPEQARQRHRFVSDGAVPVVMLNRADSETTALKERLAALETTLETERTAHTATRRALAEAQAAHQALQTRFGHTELAHGEALKADRDARRVAEEALAALRVEHPAQARRPARAPALEAAAESAPGNLPPQARKPRMPAVPKEPKPVRWWTPSFRAKR